MPRIDNVTVWGTGWPAEVEVDGPGGRIDGTGCILVPSFVDLGCDPGFPGFPTREDAASLAAAALAGGFADLVTSPRTDPVVDTPEHLADMRRSHGGVRRWPLAALTRGLAGVELAEIGLFTRHGIAGVSDGGVPVADTVVLRNALEYARGFGVRVYLRPADPYLDTLGHVHESARAATLGLRGNPRATEEIGVARIVALVRSTGGAVHLGPVGTARGVEAIRLAQADGLPVTAHVAARSLLLDEDVLADGTYDTRFRLHPPLRTAADREALVAGVRDGILFVAADHQPRAPEEKELEFERSIPGSTGLESAFAATLTAVGDVGIAVRALALGPRTLLPRAVPGLALVDPGEEQVVDVSRHASMARNDALAGRRVRGRVRACFPTAGAPVTLDPGQ